jgi:hypothetical protein
VLGVAPRQPISERVIVFNDLAHRYELLESPNSLLSAQCRHSPCMVAKGGRHCCFKFKLDHRRELETTSRGLESLVSMVVLPLARLIQLWQQLAKCTFNFHLDTGSHSHLVALLADLMRQRLPSIVPGQPCSTGGQLLAIGNYLVLHGISSHAASGQFLEEPTEMVTFPSTPRL